MPVFSFTVSSYIPFTKILSANINSDKADIVTFLNTTKIDDSNIQNAGITRSTKLKPGVADYVVINSGTGTMSEEAQLSPVRGGLGVSVVPGSQSPGDIPQINSTSTGFTVGPPSAVAASLRVYQFYNFS